MADNVAITAGAGTTIATDDVGGVQYQRVKNVFGADGVATDVTATTPMPVYGPDLTTSGTISATDAVVAAPAGDGSLRTGTPTASSYLALALAGDAAVTVMVSGTFGSGTVWFEASVNSTTGADGSWTTLSARLLGTTGSTVADSTTTAGVYRLNSAGFAYFRARITGATAPSVTTVIRASTMPGPTALNAPLPAGSATIGAIKKAPSATGTITSVTSAATSTQLLASNTSRLGATFYNDSTAILYLALSTSASTTAYTVQVPAAGYFELPNDGCGYVGAVFGIWSSANGAARVTELT